MTKYTNSSALDLYYDDRYEELLYEEENEKYGNYDDEYPVMFFPKVAYDFIDSTFYNIMDKQAGYSDVLKFTILCHTNLNPYIHSDYYINMDDSELEYHIKCIQEFITSVLNILPNEIICLILIGQNNYLKFNSN